MVAIVLHWLIAVLIVANICVGLGFKSLGKGLLAFQLIQAHKSIGLTVLALSCARLGWRLANPAPALIAPLWQKRASSAVHALLYVLMFALPLTGWIMVSASALNLPTLYFGLFPVPHIGPVRALEPSLRKSVGAAADTAHGALVYAAYALIAVHAAAALKHQFMDRDDVLARMIPFIKSSKTRSAHAV